MTVQYSNAFNKISIKAIVDLMLIFLWYNLIFGFPRSYCLYQFLALNLRIVKHWQSNANSDRNQRGAFISNGNEPRQWICMVWR